MTVSMMTEELKLLDSKHTLGWVDEDAVLTQTLKNHVEVLLVLPGVGTGKEDVINIGVSEM